MLGLGLAVSHAPSMCRGREHWPQIHRVLTDGVPQPAEIEKETPEVIKTYIDRIHMGFDVSETKELKPVGRPKRGLGHAFTRPVAKVTPQLNVPIIPLHVNCYFAPMPSARQCYELGRAIARALKDRPERVAILASGGLSHDPRGPRAGWIDTALDRWVLEQLRSGNAEALCHLFEFDSDTLRSGTGEIRSWIVVAGACSGTRATIIDYIPAHHAVTGLGFAHFNFLT